MNLPEVKKQLSVPYRVFWFIAAKIPFLLPFMIRSMKEKPKPGKPKPESNKMLHPADFKALNHGNREDALLKTIDEVLSNGTKGAVYDVRMYIRKWDFSIEDIRFPVTMFHGEADMNSPIGMIYKMVEHYPSAKLVCFKDEAHFSTLLNHFDEIAAALSA
jgi:hypothetical protein